MILFDMLTNRINYFKLILTFMLLMCTNIYIVNGKSNENLNDTDNLGKKLKFKIEGSKMHLPDAIVKPAISRRVFQYNTRLRTDPHSSTALLDILFNDASKRVCTGAVVHPSAVLTAAHCFMDNFPAVEPELVMSFIVIGDKNLYTSGYERYITIERVLVHPDYHKGWNCDIALVYSTSPLTAHGKVISLWSFYNFTEISNTGDVTVISWGQKQKPETRNIPKVLVTYTSTLSTTSQSTLLQGNASLNNLSIAEGVKRAALGRMPTDLIMETRDNRYSSDENMKHIMGSRRLLNLENRLSRKNFYLVDTRDCVTKLRNKNIADLTRRSEDNYYKMMCVSDKINTITKGDAGALVVKNNYLLGIIVDNGNNKQNGPIVALRMSCFCSWISQNMPNEEYSLQCCEDCCQKPLPITTTTEVDWNAAIPDRYKRGIAATHNENIVI